MSEATLRDLSVGEFVEAVASIHQPVPAGGSVAALAGAASAALLSLVCGVRQRHQPGALATELHAAERLRGELLELVDEDAAAFHAFLAAKRSRGDLAAAGQRVATVPLRIGRGCVEVVELSFPVEAQTTGSLLGDVRAARHLADAGVRTALDLAEQNVDLQADAAARQALQEEIARLRARASPSAH